MKRGPEKQFDPDVALSQAMEVFWARGYEAASLSELFAAMGIGKKSLYDTFGNKRSLFLKCLEHYAATSLTCLEGRLCAADGKPVIPKIRTLLEEWRKASACSGSKGCMLGNNIADFDTSDPEVSGIMQRHLETIEDAFAKALAAAQDRGETSLSDTPRNVARAFVCLGQGAALISRVTDCGKATDGAIRAATKGLMPAR
jgi:TetR/AcrR family transcriptional repressor of nem operon